jgi:hypothetical protein
MTDFVVPHTSLDIPLKSEIWADRRPAVRFTKNVEI